MRRRAKAEKKKARPTRWQTRGKTAKPRVVVVGFGRLGGALSLRLKAAGWPVAVLPRSTESVRKAARLGLKLADHDDLSAAVLCVLAVPDGLGGVSYFALFGRRKDRTAVGLTYAVEFSDALSGWNLSGIAPTVVAQDSEIEAVTIPFPPTMIDPLQGYFRVNVNAQ